MKTFFIIIICIICTVFQPQSVRAQTALDGIMMAGGEICFGLIYDHGTWDKYWEGTLVRKNGNIGLFTRQAVVPMMTLGIIERINLIAELPYVSTKSDGGQLTGVSGMQDLSLALKGMLVEKTLGKGTLYVFPVVGFSTPVSNYLPDYMPYSIGLGAEQITARGIVQYKFDMGAYFRASASHLWRTYARAERDYYYNNGSYYSEWMDVPNAWFYQATAGMWMLKDALRVQVDYTVLRSTSGDDIRFWNPGQPTNKMEMDQVGAFAHYYFSKPAGLGIIGYYNVVTDGRNIGKSANVGGGITYQFKLY